MRTEQRQTIPILQNQVVVFSKNLRERIERFIYKLWQMSEVHISSPA